MSRRRKAAPPKAFKRTSLRHRHPRYPAGECGVQVIPLEDGGFQQLGRKRRTCWNCKKPLRQKDLI